MICARVDQTLRWSPPSPSYRKPHLLVNQCLENHTEKPERAVPSTLSEVAGTENMNRAASVRGRVLLLEDDASLNEIISGFLTENGYTAVVVPNGGEGIREILAGDFSVVLCDLLMPTLPGDMFYRAVERIRPSLCERFVFMTGHRDDARTSQFIKDINGYVLRKPFQLKDLLDSIALAEVRGTFESVCPLTAGDPDLSQVCPAAIPAERGLQPAASPLEGNVVGFAQDAPVDQAPWMQEPTHRSCEPRLGERAAFRMGAAVGVAVILILGAMLSVRQMRAYHRAAAASAERQAVEAEWRKVSAQLEQAEMARGGFASLPKRAKRLAEERHASGWTAALRAVATTAGPEIELRGVTACGIEGLPGACELVINGMASGPGARGIADGFYQALGQELERRFPRRVSTQIETLDDAPETSAPSGQRASFAIVVKIASNQLPQEDSRSMK